MADYLSQAKQYLRQRLSAELSFQNNLETLIDEYAYKLVDIAYAASIPPNMFTFSYNRTIKEKVDETIEEMRRMIITYTEILAVGKHYGKKDKILEYINRDIAGDNMDGRLDSHMDTFRKEMEGITAAGLLIGASKTNIKQSIKANLRTPYQNPIFKEAARLNEGRSETLVRKGLHLGVGISNSAFNSINYLGRFAVGEGWEYFDYLDMAAGGAIGYNIYRGSSVPCSDCQDITGFHSLSEGMILPEHVCCKCIAVPVYSNG